MRAISLFTSMASGVRVAITSSRALFMLLLSLTVVSACVGQAAAQTYQQVDACVSHSCALLASGVRAVLGRRR